MKFKVLESFDSTRDVFFVECTDFIFGVETCQEHFNTFLVQHPGCIQDIPRRRSRGSRAARSPWTLITAPIFWPHFRGNHPGYTRSLPHEFLGFPLPFFSGSRCFHFNFDSPVSSRFAGLQAPAVGTNTSPLHTAKARWLSSSQLEDGRKEAVKEIGDS
jgi:hypothetical protein